MAVSVQACERTTYVDGKKHQGVKVVVSAEEMSKVVDLEKMKQQMELALTQQKNDYLTHLSLRTNTGTYVIMAMRG